MLIMMMILNISDIERQELRIWRAFENIYYIYLPVVVQIEKKRMEKKKGRGKKRINEIDLVIN